MISDDGIREPDNIELCSELDWNGVRLEDDLCLTMIAQILVCYICSDDDITQTYDFLFLADENIQ